jgi:hypothetical protein
VSEIEEPNKTAYRPEGEEPHGVDNKSDAGENGPSGHGSGSDSAASDYYDEPEPGDQEEIKDYDYYKRNIEEQDFSTGRDQAVFYSGPDPVFNDPVFDGQGPDVHSGAIATSYAEQTGKTTLEMTPGGQWMRENDPYDNPNLTDAQAHELWGRASERYAEGASGEVVAFSRPQEKPGGQESVWTEYEAPALQRNPNVTDIDIYGPAGG